MRAPLIVSACLLLVGAAQAQGELLDQQPVVPAPNYTFSGSAAWAQVLAEDFTVSAGGYDLSQVTTWAIYYTSNTPTTDNITVNLYAAVGGLPTGSPLQSWTNATTNRSSAGFTTATFQVYDVYKYEIDLGTPVSLAPGGYFIEVYNLPSNGDNWAIVNGIPDPNNGSPGFAFSPNLPAATWFVSQSQYDLAFVLEGSNPTAFDLDVIGSCPGPGSVVISNATPGGPVYLGYSFAQAPWAVPSGPCAGTTIGLDNPTLLQVLTANASGAASVSVNLPPGACGAVHAMAFDQASCTGSDIVAL